MATGHPDWFKGTVLYGIGPADEFIPIRTDEAGNLHVGYGSHAITHQDGGSDEISVEGLEGVLHLEQKSSWVKVSGKPITFTPSAHAAVHQNGGGDEISVAGLSGVLADEQPSSWALVTGKPGTFTPSAHKTAHQNDGGDEISVAGLSGVLADEQPSSWALVTGKPGTFTPSAHKTAHQNDGGDEISVAGLSGELADAQTPKSHGNTKHTPKMVEVDGTEPLTGDWDIGEGRAIRADQIKARAAVGLKLTSNGNDGLFVRDDGHVGIMTLTPAYELDVNGVGSAKSFYVQGAPYAQYYLESNQEGSLRWSIFGTSTGVYIRDSTNALNIVRINGSIETPPVRGSVTLMEGKVGILVNNPTVELDVLGAGKFTGTVTAGLINTGHGANESYPMNQGVRTTDEVTFSSLDVTNKSLLRGNASADLIHTSITVSTTWQGWDISSVVGEKVGIAVIEIRNGTGSNHNYTFCNINSDLYYNSDLSWARGVHAAQVENGDRAYILVPIRNTGYVYVRSDANHSNPTDFYLVGFI